MISYISPLDDKYISFRRAACLISKEHNGISPDELMENFKHALFMGEFDCAPVSQKDVGQEDVGQNHIDPHHDRNNVLNWLHMDCVMPKTELAIGGKALKIQPHRLYSMNLDSITSVLICAGGLPGSANDWDPFYDLSNVDLKEEAIYPRLAHIPLGSYPAHSQKLIGDIYLSSIKLKLWMMKHSFSLPSFLQDIDVNQTHKPVVELVPSPDEKSQTPAVQNDPARELGNAVAGEDTPQDMKQNPAQFKTASNDNHPVSKGRPRKAGWDRVEDLVHALHRADSRKLRKVLAHEAYATALSEFPENELPTVETIVRNMVKILEQRQE